MFPAGTIIAFNILSKMELILERLGTMGTQCGTFDFYLNTTKCLSCSGCRQTAFLNSMKMVQWYAHLDPEETGRTDE